MNKSISFHPITRIEGHAKVIIFLDEKNDVENAYFQVTEFRGFEKILINRPVEEAPLIVPRICGLCSPSHHLASVKVLDEIFDVEVNKTALKLRELFHYAGILHSHILHFFILYFPDILFPNTYSNVGFTEMMKKYPNLVKNALKIRRLSQKILEILGGSSVHPSAAIAGGFLNCLKPSQQSELLSETLDSIAILNKIIEENEEKLYNMNNDAKTVPSNFVSLYSSSMYPLYDSEKIHAISMSGELLASFKFSEYFENIDEETSPWSYSKVPYLKKRGLERGVYRVGPLARFNINDKIDSEMAEELMNKFLSNIKKPIASSSYYNIVRLIEIAYVLDKILEHLSSKNVQENAPPSKNLKIVNNEGVGIIEAPRGLLIHRYKVDADGYIKDADMIVATTQNTPIIAKEITDVSREIIHKDGVLKEKLYNVISKLIRNYDPCLSCATHSYNVPFILEMHMKDKVVYYPKTF